MRQHPLFQCPVEKKKKKTDALCFFAYNKSLLFTGLLFIFIFLIYHIQIHGVVFLSSGSRLHHLQNKNEIVTMDRFLSREDRG